MTYEEIIKQRLIARKAVELLAEPLEGEGRERFLADAEKRITERLPLPATGVRGHLRIVN